jgi:Ca2+:H+ antiporter
LVFGSRANQRWRSRLIEPHEDTRIILPSERALRTEWQLSVPVASTGLFLLFGKVWLADLSNAMWMSFLFLWLFGAILLSAFGVVRHADCLAIKLGEPFGTLILTLAVVGMEVMMISALMLTGDPDPTMARDTMFAVVMIVLNALFGIALVAGGWRHREQSYNLQGAMTFLTMLVPLSVFGLVLPYYAPANASPSLIMLRAVTLLVTTIGLYCVFPAVQTRRHPDYFHEAAGGGHLSDEAAEASEHAGFEVRSVPWHSFLLIAWLLPVILLAKKLAVVLDNGAERLGLPPALSGIVVALLILTPEGMTGIRAALGNRLQRSVNLLFGAGLTTIALTVPAVILISLATGKSIQLGLSLANQILLGVTLAVSTLTCITGRTNVLNGFIHLVLFITYFVLIFEP